MIYVKSTLFKIQLVFQLILVVLFFVLNISAFYQTIISAIFLCTVGIPHGGNDYLYQKDKSFFGLVKFLSVYLFTMLLYFAVWWYIPLIALFIFFLISFHHFGQSNFGNKNLFYLPSLLWGIWILTFPVLLHFNEAKSIFIQMIGGEGFIYQVEKIPSSVTNLQLTISGILGLFYVVALVFYQKSNLISYLIQFTLVTLWIAVTPLIVGFIVIFCLWHSLQSAQHQLIYFKKEMQGTNLSFFKSALPFSLLALIIFGVYVLVKGLQLGEAFILLSLITLPHVVVMHNIYNKNNL